MYGKWGMRNGRERRPPALPLPPRPPPSHRLLRGEVVVVADEEEFRFPAPLEMRRVVVHQQLGAEPEHPFRPPVTQWIRHRGVRGDERASVQRGAGHRGAEAVSEEVHVVGVQGVVSVISGCRHAGARAMTPH